MSTISRAEIFHLFKTFEEAWNHGSLEDLSKNYDKDASSLSILGYVYEKETILRQLHQKYPNRCTMGELVFTGLKSVSIRSFPSERVSRVVIDFEWRLKRGKKKSWFGLGLVVLQKKEGGKPLIIHDCLF